MRDAAGSGNNMLKEREGSVSEEPKDEERGHSGGGGKVWQEWWDGESMPSLGPSIPRDNITD